MPARPIQERGGTYEEAVGSVLRDKRTSLGMTQKDVANTLGDITEGMVGFWERAEARIHTVMFMRLAIQVFAVSPADLMREVELKLLDEADDRYWY